MSQQTLTTVKGGINRMKIRGGAAADVLYDLLNGRVTKEGTVVPRFGTVRETTLPSNTHGLVAFNGSRHVFSITQSSVPAGYTCHVVQDPNDPTQDIKTVHFAAPFLGALYVVIEFNDGYVQHFWLQFSTWAANTQHNLGDVVAPTVANGFLYEAHRSVPARQVWQGNLSRTVGDQVEPTTYDGFYFEVTDVLGDNPHSGTVEPTWNAADGALTYEDTNGIPAPYVQVSATPGQPLPTVVSDRYGNPAGGFGGKT